MELTELIEALSDPAAYPHPAGRVEVRQTHISVVFLAGEYAYKVKKPVVLGFVDFSTPEARLHFCQEEVRLNRRLAPDVYLGVVRVTRDGGAVRVEGQGETVEHAVKMRRLPEGATLLGYLRRGELTRGVVEEVTRRVAAFHASAERGERIASFGRFEVVAGNARENLEQSAGLVGRTLSAGVFDRLKSRLEERLAQLRPLIEARARRGVPCDTHGDLHLDHVYLFPDRAPPGDLVAVDCIEFNERFRHADPVADMAFLVMDLLSHGRADLARAFAEAYFAATGDDEGRALVAFYTAYRAAVRAKVEGLKLLEREVPAGEREEEGVRARAHWLLALGQLEAPGRRPCLVLVAGLPGSGKSTLARGLAESAGFSVVRSDEVRKELAGTGEDLYSPVWSDRTYAACLRRAEEGLFAGGRVIVDANFRRERRREPFLRAARAWGVPALLLVCRVSGEEARRRLSARREDVSDADWDVYQALAREWEEPGDASAGFAQEVSADGTPEQTRARALEILREAKLIG
jgi:uncharacterized protein